MSITDGKHLTEETSKLLIDTSSFIHGKTLSQRFYIVSPLICIFRVNQANVYLCSIPWGGEIKADFGSILLGKRFLRFSKNGEFMQMGYIVRKTKKCTQNDMTSTIKNLVLDVVQMSKIDSGWALKSEEHIFNIILNFLAKKF